MISLNKQDLINIVQQTFQHSAPTDKVKVTDMTATVVLTNGKHEDFQEVVFTIEVDQKITV